MSVESERWKTDGLTYILLRTFPFIVRRNFKAPRRLGHIQTKARSSDCAEDTRRVALLTLQHVLRDLHRKFRQLTIVAQSRADVSFPISPGIFFSLSLSFFLTPISKIFHAKCNAPESVELMYSVKIQERWVEKKIQCQDKRKRWKKLTNKLLKVELRTEVKR